MVDADSALQNVQERDKWRRRLEVLERSLEEVRGRRLREEARLRRIRQELRRVQAALEAVLDAAKIQGNPGKVDGAQRLPLRFR